MKLNVEIDLDDLFSWQDESVATIIKEELKTMIRKEIANGIKNDPKLKALVTKMQKLAIEKALEKLTEV